jgi:hypothetical protein
MSNFGLGAMLAKIRGYPNDIAAAIGKRLTSMTVEKKSATIVFEYGARLIITDEAQSCFEYRHISTDDDLAFVAGCTLLAIEEAPGRAATSEELENCDVHDICFIHIQTSGGRVTLQAHNEHNGYYGGFCIAAKLIGGAA